MYAAQASAAFSNCFFFFILIRQAFPVWPIRSCYLIQYQLLDLISSNAGYQTLSDSMLAIGSYSLESPNIHVCSLCRCTYSQTKKDFLIGSSLERKEKSVTSVMPPSPLLAVRHDSQSSTLLPFEKASVVKRAVPLAMTTSKVKGKKTKGKERAAE